MLVIGQHAIIFNIYCTYFWPSMYISTTFFPYAYDTVSRGPTKEEKFFVLTIPCDNSSNEN